jgi:predicted metal-dependent hydrolase
MPDKIRCCGCIYVDYHDNKWGSTIIRSKRKTVALYIRDGGVEVRAPLKMPKRDIDRFVASKENWI